LESHIGIPAGTIKPTVKSGWVTLEGTVDWQFQKNLAGYEVKKLKGVLGVTNNIQLKPSVTPSEVEKKIEDALKRNAQLDARRITIAVNGGKVDLYGRSTHGLKRAKPKMPLGPLPESQTSTII
jgi:osmotically-inducible protein OsmY